MRVYLAASAAVLARAVADGALPERLPVHAVTRALRARVVAEDPEADEEEVELAALLDAARSSLHLLADPREVARRLVLAADVPDADVAERPEQGGPGGADAAVVSAVRLGGSSAPLALRAVVSAHVDEAGSEPLVAAAARYLAGGADEGAGGDQRQGEQALERAEDLDLLWYDASELAPLAAEITR